MDSTLSDDLSSRRLLIFLLFVLSILFFSIGKNEAYTDVFSTNESIASSNAVSCVDLTEFNFDLSYALSPDFAQEGLKNLLINKRVLTHLRIDSGICSYLLNSYLFNYLQNNNSRSLVLRI